MSLISLFAIPAMLASTAFSQHILGYTSLGARFTKGSYILPTPNPRTNKIYVSDAASQGQIIVVNGATRTVSSTIAVGTYGAQIVANPNTNTVYAYTGDQNIYVIDGSTDQIVKTIAPVTNDNCVTAIAVDTGTSRLVALDPCSQTGYVLDASGNLRKTVSVPLTNMVDFQINPVTHRLYVLDDIGSQFVVVDLIAGTSTTVNVSGKDPSRVAIDSSLNLLYMADPTFNQVYVFDGATNALINQFQPPSGPDGVAVNHKTHVISVSGYQTIYFYHANLTLDGQVMFSNSNFLDFSVNSANNQCYVGVLPNNELAFVAAPTS